MWGRPRRDFFGPLTATVVVVVVGLRSSGAEVREIKRRPPVPRLGTGAAPDEGGNQHAIIGCPPVPVPRLGAGAAPGAGTR